MDIDQIERKYLYEACECAIRNNRLAASTMLGCAAEYLLINLNAYYQYLENNGTLMKLKILNAKLLMQNLL